MDRVNEYAHAKLAVGLASVALGLPAFIFALLGWSQTAQSSLGLYSRYVCMLGSLGAFSLGLSLARDGLRGKKLTLRF